MINGFRYGKLQLELRIPDSALIYTSLFKTPECSVKDMILRAISEPSGCGSLTGMLKKKKQGDVVIVVSDITRPIPYNQFIPLLIEKIEESGVRREEIVILIATGMHRPSTKSEQAEMFGEFVRDHYRIIDHEAENDGMLVAIEVRKGIGDVVRINRTYAEAGFRIITGLVEPHFMAGFSGGRKAICPGLVSLPTIRNFHGHLFLGHKLAKNGQLTGNPCHEEALSVASVIPPDFTINIILDQNKKINFITAGDILRSHEKAVDIVRKSSCRTVEREADLVITSCGGYPLDATFYQCVKAFVNALPAVKKNGRIIAFGGCSEGTGSPEYIQTMHRYSGIYKEFLEDIKKPGYFVKDQWQFQMHCRVLDKIGEENLYFMTPGLSGSELEKLSVKPLQQNSGGPEEMLQTIIDEAVSEGKTIACIPEGPYCAPISN